MAFRNVLKVNLIIWLNLICFQLLVFHNRTSQADDAIEINPGSLLRQLKDDLLKSYDPHIRPVKDGTSAVVVKFFFRVTHIINMDEKFQSLRLRGELILEWKDEFINWNTANYGGLTFINLKASEIWLPDVTCGYNLLVDDHRKEAVVPVRVFSNGTVQWSPSVIVEVPCSANYRHYPFDSHTCVLQFSSWSHPNYDQNLVVATADVPVSSEVIGTEWRMRKEQQIREGESIHRIFPTINVEIELERVSTIQRYICVMPTLYTISSTLLGFWLLPKETSRLLIGFSNIILTSLLLQYLALTLPAGNEIPILAQYSATCLCMSGAFILITVAVQNLWSRPGGTLPRFLARVVPTLEPWLLIRRPPMAEDGQQQQAINNWPKLALVTDRIAFALFSLVYAVLLGVLAAI